MLLPLILFFLVIMSGSFCGSVLFNKRFEGTLTFTIVFYVILSFLMGIIGLLRYSVYLVLIISFVFYAVGAVGLFKKRNFREFVLNFFTPGLFVFLIISLVVLRGIRGKVFTDSDEFSHWGDVVKVMVQTGYFGSNPGSGSIFKSYPPGISLFQYLFECIGGLVTGAEFTEWYCYFALDILYATTVLPVCRFISFRNVLGIGIIILAMLGLPYVYFEPSYVTLYAELLLGFMFGGLLLDLLWSDDDDVLFDMRFLLSLSFMVLAKDSGLLFSIMLAIAYIFVRRKRIYILFAALAVFLPKLLWSIDNAVNGVAKSFGNSFDFISFINVVLGKEAGYRKEVMSNFGQELIYNYIHLGDFGLYISYFLMALVLLVLSSVLIYLAYRKSMFSKRRAIVTVSGIFVIFVVYMFGLMLTYMYKFSAEEALELVSFYRYVIIVYLGLSIFVVYGLTVFIEKAGYNLLFNFIVVGMLVLCVPLSSIRVFFSGAYIGASRTLRSEIQEYIDLSNQLMEKDSKVWFIYEDAADSEARLAYKFGIRPNIVDGDASIRVKEEEGSSTYTAGMWMDELIGSGYDYVAPYYIDDRFIEDYGELFINIDEIGDGRIYQVDKINRKLVLVN